MGFDNKYPNRKDWRKPHRGAKAVDTTCRNHGSCSYCETNRTHKNDKRDLSARESLIEWKNVG